MKRPRAPIACFRCHHKKVRCDGGQPFCTRCQSTGSVCSYPSSRRSRNTQSNLVDPYIDHLSQLEHYIRQIEAEMNDYRTMLTMTLSKNESSTTTTTSSATDIQFSQSQQDYLKKQLYKTEQEVQESRTILAQLRLRGEQRIARMKRNQVKESKQQKGSSTTSNNKTMKNKNKNGKTSPSSIIDHSNIKKKEDEENGEENEEKEKVGSSLIKTNDLVNYNDLFLSTSTPMNSVNEAATLYPHDNISMYSAPPSTSSIHPLFSLQQQSCTSTATAEQSLYYSSLNMMDYPFTAPTDFNNNDDDNGKSINKLNNSSILTASPSHHHHNNSMFDHQLEELGIRENEHYSTSTVAAIEEATRLAQLHQFLQTNPSFNMNQQQQQNKYQD